MANNMRGALNRRMEPSVEVRLDEIVESFVRNPEKNFKCQVCLKHFSSKHCLTEHGFNHTGARPYSCQICQKDFKFASQLSVHKKIHLSSEELRWPRLTDLLKNYKNQEIVRDIEKEIIKLPLISNCQEFIVPAISIRL